MARAREFFFNFMDIWKVFSAVPFCGTLEDEDVLLYDRTTQTAGTRRKCNIEVNNLNTNCRRKEQLHQ